VEEISMSDRREAWSRREFVGLTLAATAAPLAFGLQHVAAEPPPETTRLRIVVGRSLCGAPQIVAEELLSGEGFTELQYLRKTAVREVETALASGEADVGLHFVAPVIVRLDVGDPIVILAGSHVGCFELFGTRQVRTIRDLKGKTVAVPDLRTGPITFVSSMAAYVGLDARQDITWVAQPSAEAMRLLAEGKIDAYLGFPPEPQQLRARRVGHVVVNSAVDRPWANYFCCMVTAHREFVRRHPVAAKRAVRAIVKGADLCAAQPQRAAQVLVDKGLSDQYDSALQVMKELPYGKWRELNPEDTVRFYALRLHEAGMIKASPQKLIAQGTDWRFLNDLKKELKG
jgi:NitT/TauT family transport system substrate-binding protein